MTYNDNSSKGFILNRQYLDILENNQINEISNSVSINDLTWLKVNGSMSNWDDPEFDYNKVFVNILSGIATTGAIFAYIIHGSKNKLEFYYGFNDEMFETISNSFKAFIPGVDFNQVSSDFFKDISINSNYVVTGLTQIDDEKSDLNNSLDNFCRGLYGEDFTYVVISRRISNLTSLAASEKLRTELNENSEYLTETRSGEGVLGNLSRQTTDYFVKDYIESLENYLEMFERSSHVGLWSTTIQLFSKDTFVADKMSSLLKSNFSTNNTKFIERMRFIPVKNIKLNQFIPTIINDIDQIYIQHPLGNFYSHNYKREFQLVKYLYQTVMNSDQLSVICRLPKIEFPGFYVDDYADFDVSLRENSNINNFRIGEIMFSGRNPRTTYNKYLIDINDLTRHGLIIGATGSGKTNSAKSILKNLWVEQGIPFLVIESAKREYWELANIKSKSGDNGFGDLTLFTLGSESKDDSVSYRLNPFEFMKGTSLQTHIDYLLATFKASFEMFPPMPQVLETSIFEIYKDKGWDISSGENKNFDRMFPTLTDLYYKVEKITEGLGYSNEIRANVSAALKTRINSLRIGGKGAMLDTQKSIPISKLLSNPVILELEDLGDDDTKSFVIALLLVQLYEYRKSIKNINKDKLSHLLVIEEAHRLLRAVSEVSEGNNTRAKAVEFFTNLLAEIRAFGQGIFISDQIPSKLTQDVIKNTNLKIVHRTVTKDDRELMGYSMNMDETQINYLSTLKRGFAAVYSEGDNRPKIIRMEKMILNEEYMDRKTVIKEIREKVIDKFGENSKDIKIHEGCSFCSNKCKYYKNMKKLILEFTEHEEIINLKNSIDKNFNYKELVKTYEKLSSSKFVIYHEICLIGLFNKHHLNVPSYAKYDIISKYYRSLSNKE